MSWVNTFEAAKRDVFFQQNTPKYPEPEEPYSPMIPDSTGPSFSFSGEDMAGSQEGILSLSNGDAEDSKPLGLGLSWAASVPGVSLLLGSYAGTGAGPAKSSTEVSETAEKSTIVENQAADKEASSSGSELTKPDTKPSLAVVSSPTAMLQQTRGSGPLPPVLDVDTILHSRSKSLGDNGNVVPETSGQSQQLSEIEKLMTSSHHLVPKATPLPVSE